jgi:hypothetical protein
MESRRVGARKGLKVRSCAFDRRSIKEREQALHGVSALVEASNRPQTAAFMLTRV